MAPFESSGSVTAPAQGAPGAGAGAPAAAGDGRRRSRARSRVRRPMSGVPWLILPTYNEAENVQAIVTAAGEVLTSAAPEGFRGLVGDDGCPRRPRPAPGGFRVLVVDDGSPDGTGRLADALAAEHAWVEVLHRTEKNGIGPAYLAGFRHALERGAGYVMEMDSDFSHAPADLARLLARSAGSWEKSESISIT